MDLTLTAPQEQLGKVARSWLATHAPAEPGTGAPEHWWGPVAELGWLDEELGMLDCAVLAEQTGAWLYPGGWFATVGLAAPAYRAAGRWPTRPTTLAWSPPVWSPPAWSPPGDRDRPASHDRVGCLATTGEGGVRLSGPAHPMPVPSEEAVVLATTPAGPALFRVDLADAGPAALAPSRPLDPTRTTARLHLAGTAAQPLVDAGRTPAVLRTVRWTALALLAAEAVGVAARSLEIAVAHANERVQFGRPIGANQAVAHRLADAAGATEVARLLAYRAAWCVETSAADTEEAVGSATVAAREAALDSCRAAIQTLGATGFTWQHPLHRLYRRAQWISTFGGPAVAYRDQLADALIGRGRRAQ